MDDDGVVPTRDRRGPRGLPFVPVLLAALAGCQTAAAQSCVSWMSHPDDATRMTAAHAVVDVVVEGTAGERAMFGTQAAVWSVEVTVVHKGELGAGERLEVASTPQTCSGATYPDGDPLDTDGPVRLYLRDTDFAIPDTEAGWALITPFDGVRPIS